eukprot:scaffold29_cov251-Pinguiococcus_pyrenoidosus.AAC.21
MLPRPSSEVPDRRWNEPRPPRKGWKEGTRREDSDWPHLRRPCLRGPGATSPARSQSAARRPTERPRRALAESGVATLAVEREASCSAHAPH